MAGRPALGSLAEMSFNNGPAKPLDIETVTSAGRPQWTQSRYLTARAGPVPWSAAAGVRGGGGFYIVPGGNARRIYRQWHALQSRQYLWVWLSRHPLSSVRPPPEARVSTRAAPCSTVLASIGHPSVGL